MASTLVPIAWAMQYQAQTAPVSTAPEAVSEDKWHQGWSDPMGRLFERKRAAAAIVLIASGMAAISPWALTQPETVTEDRWHQPWSEPLRFKPGLPERLQQVLAAEPFYLTQPEQITESRWHQAWSDPASVKARVQRIVLPTSQQQVLAFVDWTITKDNPAWFAPLSEPQRQKIGQPARLQAAYFAEPFGQTQPEQITESRWHQPYSERLFAKPGLPAQLQLAFAIDPYALTQPEIHSEAKWHQPYSEPLRFKPGLAARLQRDFFAEPFGQTQPESTSVDRYYIALSEPQRFKPGLRASLQLAFAIDPYALTQPETFSEAKFHQPWSERLLSKTLATAQQQTLAFVTVVEATPETVTVDKWFRELSWRLLPKAGLSAACQPTTYAAEPEPEDLDFTAWLIQFSEPQRFKSGLRASLQQAFTTDPYSLTQPETVTEDRWHQPWSERLRRNTLPTSQQQVLAFVDWTIAADRPTWFAALSEPKRFRAALLVADQPCYQAEPEPEELDLTAWLAPFGEPKRFPRALAAPLQLAFAIDPYALTQPEVTTESRWHQPWSERLLRRDLATAQQQALAFQGDIFVAPETTSVDKWFRELSWKLLPKAGLLTALQRAATIDPTALTQPEFLGPSRWLWEWARPLPPRRVQIAPQPAHIDVTTPGSLDVTPSTALSFSGVQGGPFTPSTGTYTLSNDGDTSIAYTVTSSVTWLDLTNASGTLAGGASIDVVVSVNSVANALGITLYSGTLTFTNLTNGDGNTTRVVGLDVQSPWHLVPPAPDGTWTLAAVTDSGSWTLVPAAEDDDWNLKPPPTS